MVTFVSFPLMWVSKLQTFISLSTLHSEYVVLSRSVRALLALKILIKEVIYNLGIDSGAWNKLQLLTINFQVVNYFLDKTFQGK